MSNPTRTELKALVTISGNLKGCHIGRTFSRATWDKLTARGWVSGGATEDAALDLTAAGAAALHEAL